MDAGRRAQGVVVVVGAGLVGLAVSALLARRGIGVLVVEAHEDPRIIESNTLRSIGLTLCARGLRALDGLALGARLRNCLMPTIGRRVHFTDGTQELQRYDLVGDGTLYSVRRSTLLSLLCAAAHEAGVQFQFGSRCIALDGEARRIAVVDATGRRSELEYEALMCADGARSLMRSQLVERHGATAKLVVVPEAYKEINIRGEAARRLDPNALHVWPRDEHLLIALPNIDGSFAASLFMPPDEPLLQGTATVGEATAYLEQRFPELLHLAPACAAELAANPPGRMTTVECDRWSYPGNVLLLGDAAHAMLPFYGQGMNCAFEGCELLVRLMEAQASGWGEVFDEFERLRRRDVEVMWGLSRGHRGNLGHRVAEEAYRQRRELETALQRRYPDRFMPLYGLLAFSTLPYAEALARAEYQDAVLDKVIASREDASAEIDMSIAEKIAGELSPLPAGVQNYKPEWLPPGPRRAPLSFSQERIWFFEKYWPEDSGYSLSIPIEVRGPLDVRALERAFQALVDRHEALRTRIVEEHGEPWQIISPPAAFQIRHLTNPGGGPMTEEAVAAARETLGRGRIELGSSLFQCTLWRFSDEAHLLLLRVHHIVVDRFSVTLMMEELSTLYAAFTQDVEPALPPVRHQFSDYVAWERSQLQGEFLKRGLSYWRQRLEGAPALRLPSDRPRQRSVTNRNGVVTTSFPAGSTRLRELARTTNVTPFVAALACYFVLLSRWSKQSDISVGCVVANRTHPKSIGAVGCFFNTMVIRAEPAPGLVLREFLRQLRRRTSEALAYQHIPIDAIVTELRAGGDSSRRPLYQAMFTYRYGSDPLRLAGLATRPAGQRYVQAPSDLSLELIDRASEMIVVCQYDADLFEPKTIEAFVGSFGSVVESGVLDPTRRLEELLDGYQGVPDRGGEDASIPSAQAPREAPEATAEAAADAPLSPTEQLLAKLWRELLKLDDVAVTDNFFTLGGDSLLATRLTVRIQNQLRVSVTPRAVFETGSLRGLARFVDASAKSAAEPIPPRIARRR